MDIATEHAEIKENEEHKDQDEGVESEMKSEKQHSMGKILR